MKLQQQGSVYDLLKDVWDLFRKCVYKALSLPATSPAPSNHCPWHFKVSKPSILKNELIVWYNPTTIKPFLLQGNLQCP